MTMGYNEELEIKKLLSGNEEKILDCTKTVTERVKNLYLLLVGRPFFCLRAAGSFGVDVLAVRDDTVLPIEVKSSKNDKIYFSSNDEGEEQYNFLVEKSNVCKIPSFYFFRRRSIRGEKWKVYRVPSDVNDYDIPDVSMGTSSHMLNWDEGMYLSDFLDKHIFP